MLRRQSTAQAEVRSTQPRNPDGTFAPADVEISTPAASGPLAEMVAVAQAITNRVERLERGNRDLVELRDAGWMDEGAQAVLDFKRDRGIGSLQEAIAEFSRANPPPEPAVGSGRRMLTLDRAEQQMNIRAFEALMNGDDETWLQHSIAAALAECRR
jgi:hypothetical protein